MIRLAICSITNCAISARRSANAEGGGGGAVVVVDQEKVLKVSWGIVGEDYSEDKLRELFSNFGEVEDVVKRSEKRGYVLVLMATKEGAVAANGGGVIVRLPNPLLVLPTGYASRSFECNKVCRT